MNVTKNELPKKTLELTIELSPGEVRPHLERAAQQLSKARPVKGFRPGKATVETMRQSVGDDVLLQEALEPMVQDSFVRVVREQQLETVGAPKIEVLKIAFGNPFTYKATVALLPNVTLGDYRGLKIAKPKAAVTDDEVEKVLTQLRESRSQEKLVMRPARMGDKVEIDFQGFLDKVPVEGASSKTHPLVLGSHAFIPGFEEQIVGMKAGEEREFTLRFPKDYFQKNLAEKDVVFRVKVQNVYERTLPATDDAFAKDLGMESMEELTKRLRTNLEHEKKEEERKKYETAILEKIVEISTFDELPDMVVEGEIDKMFDELKGGLSEQGMAWEKYLESIKKDEQALRKEFWPKAERRLRIALVTRAIAAKEKISADDAEIAKELEDTKKLYEGNAEVLHRIESPDYFSYLQNVLTNKRVMTFLDELIGVEDNKS